MNKILLAFATLIVLAACSQKPTATPKITTAEEFGKLFGMATTMGEDVSGVARRKSEAAGGCFRVARRRSEAAGGCFLGHEKEKETDFWKIFCRRGEELDYFLYFCSGDKAYMVI